MNHQKALDKRLLDHQRELQLLELHQFKEKADLEEKTFEEIQSLKITQSCRILETQSQHVDEMHIEKDRLYEVGQKFKLSKLEIKHIKELKQMTETHRSQTRQMRIQFQQMMKQRKLKHNQPDTTSFKNETTSREGKQIKRNFISQSSSEDSLNQDHDDCRITNLDTLQEYDKEVASVIPEDSTPPPEIVALHESIRKLASRQCDDIETLQRSQKSEYDSVVLFWEDKARELEISQTIEMESMKQSHTRECAEIKVNHDREIKMAAAVHDTEMKMLLERRLLSSVLNTVVDAIITIDPI
ncbi:hypothetical protein HK096_001154, partial [Nowakowskiella sp. JEL0078]